MKRSVGEVLKFSRIDAGITAKEISKCLKEFGFKASVNTIYNWENDISQPTPDALLIMCEKYGIKDILSTFGYGDIPNDVYGKKEYVEVTPKLSEKAVSISYAFDRSSDNVQRAVSAMLEPYMNVEVATEITPNITKLQKTIADIETEVDSELSERQELKEHILTEKKVVGG